MAARAHLEIVLDCYYVCSGYAARFYACFFQSVCESIFQPVLHFKFVNVVCPIGT